MGFYYMGNCDDFNYVGKIDMNWLKKIFRKKKINDQYIHFDYGELEKRVIAIKLPVLPTLDASAIINQIDLEKKILIKRMMQEKK